MDTSQIYTGLRVSHTGQQDGWSWSLPFSKGHDCAAQTGTSYADEI